MMNISVLLFEDFETLDVFGPVEIFGVLKEHYRVKFYSLTGGIVKNAHGVAIESEPLKNIETGTDIFIIPGGYGTRKEVHNRLLIELITQIATESKYVLTVCTGSGLLARTGLLNGRVATSNKRAFNWVMEQGTDVSWQKKARWTVDGKFYTSAGVSAGMDMVLGFLNDVHGAEFARDTASRIEYNWQENKEEDNFYDVMDRMMHVPLPVK